MKIDCHNHAIPETVLDLLRSDDTYGVQIEGHRWRGGNHVDFEVQASFRDPAAKLAELRENGLDGAVVSVAPPLFYYELEREPALALSEATNRGLAELHAAEPSLWWACDVPLQFPEVAAEVLAGAAAEDGCVGVEIGTSVAGRRLDEPEFEVFWEAAGRLGTPVMIHPDFTYGAQPGLESYYFNNVIGLPLETTLTVERLIAAGVLSRHPGVRLMLVHAGGYFPYQAGRFKHARTVRPELADSPTDPWEFTSQIWFDVITHDRQALSYLRDRVGIERLVMGTDLPFDMALPNPATATADALGADGLEQVAERNPVELFGL